MFGRRIGLAENAIRQAEVGDVLEAIKWKVSERYRPELEERVRRISRTIRNREILEQLYEFYGPGLEVPDEQRFFNNWLRKERNHAELNRALSRVKILSANGEKLLELGADPASASEELEFAIAGFSTAKIRKLREKGVTVSQRGLEALIINNVKNGHLRRFIREGNNVVASEAIDYERLLRLVLIKISKKEKNEWIFENYSELFEALYEEIEDRTTSNIFQKFDDVTFTAKALIQLRESFPESNFREFVRYRLSNIPRDELLRAKTENRIMLMGINEFLEFSESSEAQNFEKIIWKKAAKLLCDCFVGDRFEESLIKRLEDLLGVDVDPREENIFLTLLVFRPTFIQNWLNFKPRAPEELDLAVRQAPFGGAQFNELVKAGAKINLDREKELRFSIKRHRNKKTNQMIAAGVRIPLIALEDFASAEVILRRMSTYMPPEIWLLIETAPAEIKFMQRIIKMMKRTSGKVLVEERIQKSLEILFHHWLFSINEKDLFAAVFEAMAKEVSTVQLPKEIKYRRLFPGKRLEEILKREIPNYRRDSNFGSFLRRVRQLI
jgi:hypothetical protein